MSCYVTLESPLTWKRLGKALIIEGVALAEGTYTDLSGKTVTYPFEALKASAETLLGVPIVYPHTLSDNNEKEVAVGHVTEIAVRDNAILFKGMIFDPHVQELVEKGKLSAVSVEANVDTDFDPESGVFRAERLEFTALALTEAPACPSCRILEVRPVQLEKSGGVEKVEEHKESTPAESKLAEERPSKTEFFDAIKKALVDAGVEEDTAKKVIDVLKDFIQVPYPYPYPAPAKQEVVESMSVVDSPSELEQLKKRVAELEEANKKLTERYNAILEEQIGELVAEIKKIDRKFELEKFCSGVEDKSLRINMLKSYLETLQRVAPSTKKLELGENKPKLEDVVKNELRNMFGTDNLDEVFG